MIHDGYILPCYHSDGFCKPTTRTPYILTWFDEKFFSHVPTTRIHWKNDKNQRSSLDRNRQLYLIDSSNITTHFQTEGIKGTKYPNVKTPQSTVDNPSLSRFEINPIAQTFCGKPEPLY